jgi:hypothetical protein
MSDEAFIIYYSKYSNACLSLSDKINFIAPHFNITIIDIDNPHVRNNILNATSNKITKVPAVMLFIPNEKKLETHEGEKAVQIIDKAVYMVQQKMQQQSPPPQRQIPQQQPQYEEERVEPPRTQVRKSSNVGKYSSLEDVLESNVNYDEGEANHKKVGKGLVSDPRFANTNGDRNMVSTVGERPVYGEGHENISSTLAEYGQNIKQKTYTPMGPDFEKGKKPKIEQIDELVSDQQYSDTLFKPEDDAVGLSMDDILAPENSSTSPSKEANRKSSAVKNAAEQIARERDSFK